MRLIFSRQKDIKKVAIELESNYKNLQKLAEMGFCKQLKVATSI